MSKLTLPCKHGRRITDQVQPTINLLTNMDELYPELLVKHSIEPADYKSGLVFRSAIESIRGTFIASSVTGREGLVRDVLENLLQKSLVHDYKQSSTTGRYDFTVCVEKEPDYFTALEVKGGEGNSINISERPIWAKEFGVWCHLDGAIVNQPAYGAHSIINRLTNELVRRHKVVDVLFFKDMLCGTRARPCPKYPNREDKMGLQTAPDIFLLPTKVPSLEDPEPSVHTLETIRLPSLILNLFQIKDSDKYNHIWEVHIKLIKLSNGNLRRSVNVQHQGKVIDESLSRPWRP